MPASKRCGFVAGVVANGVKKTHGAAQFDIVTKPSFWFSKAADKAVDSWAARRLSWQL